MRRLAAYGFLVAMACAVAARGDPVPKRGAPGTLIWDAAHVPDVLLVGFLPSKSVAARDAVHAKAGARLVHRYARVPVDVVHVAPGADLPASAAAYAKSADVAYAEPNYVTEGAGMPNDPMFAMLWNLRNTGQSGGIPDADIDAPEAWNVTAGSRNIIVGVLDSGVDYRHEDLAANLWTNTAELDGAAGVDDDGNGIVDDVYGARWTGGVGTITSGDPMDGNGHGTHVAGILGAVGNNGRGIAGVCWSVRVMALRFKDDTNNGTVADAIAALEYAVDKGADLTNNSYRFTAFSQAFEDAINAAGAAGQLFVAAAANAAQNSDLTPSYPGAYDCPNIISVAASDDHDAKAVFTNWGPTTVDLAAPGVDVFSTLPNNQYGSMDGTSMAAPHVSGVAALLLTLYPAATPATVKDWIFRSVDVLPVWEGLTVTGGRLNAAKAAMLAAYGDPLKPRAAFTAEPVSGPPPLIVHFQDQSITGPSPITEWFWDFGDGDTTDADQNPVHRYDAPGTYTVSLTVTNSDGSNTLTKTGYVIVISNTPITSPIAWLLLAGLILAVGIMLMGRRGLRVPDAGRMS